MPFLSTPSSWAFFEHVDEQLALFDGVVEGNMGVGRFGVPIRLAGWKRTHWRDSKRSGDGARQLSTGIQRLGMLRFVEDRYGLPVRAMAKVLMSRAE